MMDLATVSVIAVVILHIYFLILEMFFWDKPPGLKIFGHSQDFAQRSRILAMNQGLYNGFLAAGLIWGLYQGAAGTSITLFFLSCVIIAGIFGGLTASRKILLFQALPAIVAFIFVY